MTSVIVIVAVLIANIVGSVGALCLKIGASRGRRWYLNRQVIIGFALYGIGLIIATIALKYGELNVVYSLSATAYIWIALFSKWFLHEKLPFSRVVGIVAIIIGVVLVSVF